MKYLISGILKLTLCLVKKLQNQLPFEAFKNLSKKFIVQVQSLAEEKERTSTFRILQNVPLDVLNFLQKNQVLEFKMLLNVLTDMRKSSQEAQDPEFKMPDS